MERGYYMKEIIHVVEKLVNKPSPTGYTTQIMKWVQGYIENLDYTVEKTNKGSVLFKLAGKSSSSARLLTAHVDTLGAMVREVKADGRLKLNRVGGFTWNAVENEGCSIHTRDGRTYRGTILMHQSSVHVYAKSGTIDRSDEHIEVRIDEKTTSKDQTSALGISVGDVVSFDARFEHTASGFIKSRHLDDKLSVALLLSLAKKVKDESLSLPVDTYIYISNNEEIGYGGNSSIPSNVSEYLAVDMGALGDGQASNEYTVSICAKDGSGPYHYELTSHLISLAKEHDIPHAVDIYPYYASDASAAVKAGADVKHALCGAGIESSHAYERTHEDSMNATYRLLEKYILSPLV
ncbi:M42 family metallopeptidase [Chryseomicrobium palamuruense]|uniref:M42 family metallopeptidase n=1 Tax=Chryseomicrobium palamuruense TaxID=682973 RepID=A0ABV8UQU0_9BACL